MRMKRKNIFKILAGLGFYLLLLLLLKRTSGTSNHPSPNAHVPSLAATASNPPQDAKARNASALPSSAVSPEQLVLRREILDLLATNDPRNINRVYNELLPALVKMDPHAAAEFAQSPEAAKWRSDLMMVVAQNWAKLNTDDAQAWASQLQNPSGHPTERDTILSYVSFAVADTNPERAVQVLADCPINKDRFEIMVENLAQQFADQGNMQPLVDLISKLPPGAERDGYFARLANAMARSDAVAAATLVSEEISPGPAQDDATLNIVGQWAWNDKAAARQWVDAFPPGELRDRALKKWTQTVAARQGLN